MRLTVGFNMARMKEAAGDLQAASREYQVCHCLKIHSMYCQVSFFAFPVRWLSLTPRGFVLVDFIWRLEGVNC